MQLQYNDDDQWVRWARCMTRINAVVRQRSETLVLQSLYHKPKVMDRHYDRPVEKGPSHCDATKETKGGHISESGLVRFLERGFQTDSLGSSGDMDPFAIRILVFASSWV